MNFLFSFIFSVFFYFAIGQDELQSQSNFEIGQDGSQSQSNFAIGQDGSQSQSNFAIGQDELQSHSNLEMGQDDLQTHLRNRNPEVQSRIFNGYETIPYQYPFQVSIYKFADSKNHCGGSLIGPSHVLTAAHCFEKESFKDFLIVAGAHALVGDVATNTAATRKIAAIIPHPKYNPTTIANDILLVKTVNPFKLTKRVNPATMVQQGFKPRAGISSIMTGWGYWKFTVGVKGVVQWRNAPRLQYLPLRVLDEAECKRYKIPAYYGDDFQICAMPGKNQSAGFGDSGGPLFYYETKNPQPFLFGVFSTSDKSGGVIDKNPLVFSNVGAYRKWIGETMSKF